MDYIKASDQISLFCRLNINTKKGLPIRSSEMGMLIYLVQTDNEKSPKAMAEFFKVTKAMITNMLTSLQEKGYVLKQKSNVDKRSITILPTDKAISLVNTTYQEYYHNLNILNEKMGSDKFEELLSLLSLANNILLEEKENG